MGLSPVQEYMALVTHFLSQFTHQGLFGRDPRKHSSSAIVVSTKYVLVCIDISATVRISSYRNGLLAESIFVTIAIFVSKASCNVVSVFLSMFCSFGEFIFSVQSHRESE